MSEPLTPEREAEIEELCARSPMHRRSAELHEWPAAMNEGWRYQRAATDLLAEVRRLRAENEKIYASNKFLEQRCARLEADRHPSMSPRKNTEP